MSREPNCEAVVENADVAQLLGETADLLELTGGNAFKARAYRRAAQLIALLPEPVASVSNERLQELPGIGANLAQHVAEILQRGTFEERDQLAQQLPHGLVELLRIEGVGPKTVSAAWRQLGVTSVDALEKCCLDGRLAHLTRMGPKRAAGILAAIQRFHGRAGRVPLHEAIGHAEALLKRLRQQTAVRQLELAGSVRRHKETVGDIDLLVGSEDPEAVWRALREAPETSAVVATGPTKLTLRLRSGLQVDVRVVPPESFGAALHYFTGSKNHNIAIRTRAVKRGLKLSEYGVFDRHDRRIGGATEEEVFRAVGLPWIPPELREDTGEIEAAERGELPDLVEEDALRGDLHVHSDRSSDAHSSIEALADAASRLGRRYLAITDHSQSRPLGLTAAALQEEVAEVRRVDHQRGGHPRLLTGIEVDILPDGTLDLPREVLRTLDCVVASVHSHFNQSRLELTRRITRALRSGCVHVLAHPTGRQLGARDAADLDLEQILEVAREHGVALEVNAMPERLDLGAEACREAKKRGVPVVISSDAHHESQLANLRYGVWMARRGWLEAEDVLTTLPLPQLRRRLLHRPRLAEVHASSPGGL